MYTGVPGQPGVYKQIDLVSGEVGLHSTPTVVDNVVIAGGTMKEGFQISTQNNTKGLVRGWDVLTGKLLWTFHDIPQKGEFGYDSWDKNSADYNGNAGVWTASPWTPRWGTVYCRWRTPPMTSMAARARATICSPTACVRGPAYGKMKWYINW